MYTIGIDLGGTNIAAGIVNDNYEIIQKDSVPTGADRPGEEIVKDMAALCKKIIADAGLTEADIEYIGIATPGTADSDTGVVVYANNLKFLDFPIADLLKKYIGIERVLIENDANAAAKGEAIAGAAKGYANSVMITLGTGVGGGIIIDNKVYSGFNHAGAELGHIVIEYNGVQCSCGRKGCWEAYSSATALIRMTREKIAEAGHSTKMWDMVGGNLDNVSGRTAFNAAREDIHAGKATIVPEHIASEHPRDYVYPHNFPNHWVNQQYMPDDLLGKHYWIPDNVRQEQIRAEYWNRIKNQ
jgi:glucokinase